MTTFFNVIEYLLWRSRLFIVIAVIGGIAASIMMVIVGCISVGSDVIHLADRLTHHGLEFTQRILIINAVNAMDTFLIATVLFIFSIGLYELFIREIHVAKNSSKELLVSNLDQLKDKLAKVILMVLVVTFFKYAISLRYNDIQDLIYLAVAILLISIALFVGKLKLKLDHHKT